MQLLIALLLVVVSTDHLGLFLGGKFIAPAMVVEVFIGLCCIERFVTLRYRSLALRDRWPFWFLAFMAIGGLSLVLSPYFGAAFLKGITQIVGVALMLLTTLAILNEVGPRPELFKVYIGLCVRIFAFVAIGAVVQSFIENILKLPNLFSLAFLNQYTPEMVWRHPGSMGPLFRAASIDAEPANFVVILGIATGTILVRLGLAGKRYQRAVALVIPRWAAVVILLGFAVALSLVGYFLLLVIAMSLRLVSNRLGWRAMAAAVTSGAVLVAGTYLLVNGAAPALMEKLATTAVVVSPDRKFDYSQGSAWVLAINLGVMEQNVIAHPILGVGLGAHPISYEEQVPGADRLPPEVDALELNKDDANSLLVRLLSETGLLGTALYVGGWLTVVLRARRSILEAIDRGLATRNRADACLLALCIGVTASLVGEGVIFLARNGLYYGLPFWIPLALVACVPRLLALRVYSRDSVGLEAV